MWGLPLCWSFTKSNSRGGNFVIQSLYLPHLYWKLSSDLIWWESTKTDSEEGHKAKVERVEKRPGLDSCYEHSTAGHVAGEDDGDGDDDDDGDGDDDGDDF